MNETSKNSPKIYEFDDFRHFLKQYYLFQKQVNPAFNFRSFAQEAGFRSSATLKRVMEGGHNLSVGAIEKFSNALKLKKDEADFFKNLVLFNQAKSSEQKEHFAKEVLKTKLHQKLKPLAQDQFDYWSGWYNLVLREMVNFDSFKENPQWIAEHILPAITSKTAERSLKKLLKLGLIKKNKNGKIEQMDSNIASGDQMIYTSLNKFHRNMIKLGMESIERFTKRERQVTAVTVSLDQDQLEKIKVLINQFRKDLLALSNEGKNPARVYQINFQLFPVTKDLRNQEKKQ